MTFWCEAALVGGSFVRGVRIEASADGRVSNVESGTEPGVEDVKLAVVVPGFANTHSHAFHRLLRGQTNGDGGDFWSWRQRMYRAAHQLDPESYRAVADAVFTEMLGAGYTAVGEFHYLHHGTAGGVPFAPHAMELAVADAADDAGIRLTLLDTCYLAGGIGRPLASEQAAFTDGSADSWLERWFALRDRLATRPGIILGAAIHSVRAVDADSMAVIKDGLPRGVPLHIHLSEQPRENLDCEREYGMSPTELLAHTGLLDSHTTVVHATHLSERDVAILGAAEVAVSMCPSTEADLGDGLGHARRLQGAGAAITVGSDQNILLDPLTELRVLETNERLATGTRGVFTPAELWRIGSGNGYRSLGWATRSENDGIAAGAWCDLVELDPHTVRTLGSRLDELMFSANAGDVRRTIVGGHVRRTEHAADKMRAALLAFAEKKSGENAV